MSRVRCSIILRTVDLCDGLFCIVFPDDQNRYVYVDYSEWQIHTFALFRVLCSVPSMHTMTIAKCWSISLFRSSSIGHRSATCRTGLIATSMAGSDRIYRRPVSLALPEHECDALVCYAALADCVCGHADDFYMSFIMFKSINHPPLNRHGNGRQWDFRCFSVVRCYCCCCRRTPENCFNACTAQRPIAR